MKTYKLLFLIGLCLLSISVLGQDTLKYEKWGKLAGKNPDSVFAIDASKLGWTNLPHEIYQYKNLKALNLAKNKFHAIPDSIHQFKKLRTLDLTKNKLDVFPVQLCAMENLRKLILGQNAINSIPSCIQHLQNLKYLDLWDNPLKGLPDEFAKLSSLQLVDLRGILFSARFQEKWEKLLPSSKWKFDAPCNCLD